MPSRVQRLLPWSAARPTWKGSLVLESSPWPLASSPLTGTRARGTKTFPCCLVYGCQRPWHDRTAADGPEEQVRLRPGSGGGWRLARHPTEAALESSVLCSPAGPGDQLGYSPGPPAPPARTASTSRPPPCPCPLGIRHPRPNWWAPGWEAATYIY